jgi:hypothetical protein
MAGDHHRSALAFGLGIVSRLTSHRPNHRPSGGRNVYVHVCIYFILIYFKYPEIIILRRALMHLDELKKPVEIEFKTKTKYLLLTATKAKGEYTLKLKATT